MNVDRFSLAGHAVAITGASGMLGGHFAAAIARAGASVALLDLIEPSAQQMDGIRAGVRDGAEVIAVPCDVRDDASVQSVHLEVEAALGPIGGLVNCAAIDAVPSAQSPTLSANGPFESAPSDAFTAALDVNVHGVVRCCQVFGAAMARRGQGSIVNIASHYGVVAPDQRTYASLRESGTEFFKPAVYTASKSAVIGLTRYLAAYWGAVGVRVNSLSPGGVRAGQSEKFVEAYSSRTPLGRMARPDEYDGAVVFMLSDASSYMTGANLIIDGGFTAW
jgi:NAD(P)-dependent dehydrogenase (short-subunit alcohol dehydrogenase family)